MRYLLLGIVLLGVMGQAAEGPAWRWADETRGRPFSKDPSVVRFGDRFLLYYSIAPQGDGRAGDGWAIGIAESTDLTHWRKIGELGPEQACEKRGLCAPGAWVRNGVVHLFYQTYGNGAHDAICHAWSRDGVNFTRNPTNPVFAPTGPWTAGRAIDAEVVPWGERLLLYFATRDPAMKVQMIGVAAAPLDSDYSRDKWVQLVDGPVLRPELPWERRCIEAASIVRRGDTLVMFYAGSFNNEPQQIGVATSPDGLTWTRLSSEPFLTNGPAGAWNSSESGHPGAFDDQGRTVLFFQGNNDNGKTWYLSSVDIKWDGTRPILATPPR
jgi:predicted GH43/DUF377 family glycosyl hydrolase